MRSCILRSDWVFSPKMVQCRWCVCVIISKPQEKRDQCTLCCLSELDLEQYLELWSQQVSSLSHFPSHSAKFSPYFNIVYLVCPPSRVVQIYLFPPPVFDLCYRILTQSGVLLQWVIVFIVISEDSVSALGPGRGSFGSVWVNLLRSILSHLNLFNFLSRCTSLWFACSLCCSSSLLSSLVCRHFDRSALSSHIWLLRERVHASPERLCNVRTSHPSRCVTVCFNMGCGMLKMRPGGRMTEWSVERDVHGHVMIQPHLWEKLGKNDLHSTPQWRKVKRTKHCGEF